MGLIGTMNRVVSIGMWYRQMVGHLQLGWGVSGRHWLCQVVVDSGTEKK